MIDLASIPSLIQLGLFELGRRMGLFRGLHHTLTIRAYDRRGRLIAMRFVRQKLILDNFKEILAAFLNPEAAFGAQGTTLSRASAVDMTGLALSPAIVAHAYIPSGERLAAGLVNLASQVTSGGGDLVGVRIRIGTGTVTPARADYTLGSEVASGVPTRTIGPDYVTWGVAITLVTGATITEAGMSLFGHGYGVNNEYWSPKHFLLFRDVFTGVEVPDGGTISVTERVSL